MSDNFEMLVDVEVTVEEAEVVASAVLDRFRELDLITGPLNRDCVLGEAGYCPGPAVPDLYELGQNEHPFWELRTCGVEPQVGRDFNSWALGPVLEGFTCPLCGGKIEPSDDEFADSVWKAIGEWMEQSGPARLQCPRCGKERSIDEWDCHPPLGFGNLGFLFWNWPPLDSPSWTIDLAAIVREVTGHKIVRTYGHI